MKGRYDVLPREVLTLLDSGKNPDEYTKDCLEKAMTTLSRAKIKTDAIKVWKADMFLRIFLLRPCERV